MRLNGQSNLLQFALINLLQVEMRIPDGAEFAEPDENVHFSSVFVFHKDSKTIHDDDTLMYFDPDHVSCCVSMLGARKNLLQFHLTLTSGGLKKGPGSMQAFKEWVQKLIVDWDFDNICTAHYGVVKGGARKMLSETIATYERNKVM